MTPVKVLFIAYPPSPDDLFERVAVGTTPSGVWQFLRAQTAQDIIDQISAIACYNSIDLVDIFGHGGPGFLELSPDEALFDCQTGTFALGELATLLPKHTPVRFLGCKVAAPDDVADKSWTFDPMKGLGWLSKQLGGRPVAAPEDYVHPFDFGPTSIKDEVRLLKYVPPPP